MRTGLACAVSNRGLMQSAPAPFFCVISMRQAWKASAVLARADIWSDLFYWNEGDRI